MHAHTSVREGFNNMLKMSARLYERFSDYKFLQIQPHNLYFVCSFFHFVFKNANINLPTIFFFKIPIFDIFIDMQKSLLQIFALTCKNVYFEPKFNLNGKILRQGHNEGF